MILIRYVELNLLGLDFSDEYNNITNYFGRECRTMIKNMPNIIINPSNQITII